MLKLKFNQNFKTIQLILTTFQFNNIPKIFHKKTNVQKPYDHKNSYILGIHCNKMVQ